MDVSHIEQLFEEYQRQRTGFTELHTRMRALSATATSARREVSVTVGQNGVLTDVQFPTGAHRRLPPADLARLVLETYNTAKEDVFEQAASILAPVVPTGVDVHALVRGTAGADAFMPKEPRIPTSVRELLGRTA
ncbi:hypothetical protein Val02_72170 [Virgisporangium aliadipatigenens]|uniref:YbaB/EbfC DNA-binding family protein n=1 Tax=Virgisporangium aliadipatigenens TaxID=741659 RepID=A0A8J3YV23_9ACTN|nr:YbaB/EbfC family nucleoid-associated protein [Virgisporangium aliadipatigenens]GIJ50331.1 hypothetical protein Val02_72170 [Virgisporangium aliadipatigenens]